MSDKRLGQAPALFDDAAFAEDMRRASDAGEEAALKARREFEAEGVALEALLACDEDGPDGTALRHCVKLRLPPPDGKFGMVFRIELRMAGPCWSLLPSGFVITHPRRKHRRSTRSHITV